MISEYQVLIRENHLDSYGHVNNATYLALFEEARWQVLTERDYGYQKIHESGQGPIILEVQMKFLKELKLREKIRISLELISSEGKVSLLKQIMINPHNEVACELFLKVGFFDLKTRKLIVPTSAWKKALGQIEANNDSKQVNKF
ncbi:MAG: acyl-CoA thioesterase [Bdellovibrionaceae bacterium]|nr:acyl-CoA thioesterase [Bdellovibrio sp.]